MNDYYEGLTEFVNTHEDFLAAGLKPLMPEQVQAIVESIPKIDAIQKHSTSEPLMIKWSELWWATKAKPTARRCVAKRTDGSRQCLKPALAGGTVCKFHGGAARHVRNAARARLANAADRMAKELLHMATDEKVSDAVKLNAIRDALDRAGLKPGVEVEITTKPVDQIITQIQGGSRDAYRRGIAEPSESDSAQHTPALASTAEPLDAEIVDDDDESHFDTFGPMRSPGGQQGRTDTVTSDGDVWPSTAATEPGTYAVDDSVNPFGPSGPPVDQLMTREDAYAAQADMRRRVAAQARAAGHATVRRVGQRALPPGRS